MSLLFKKEIEINESVSIKIPTLKEILQIAGEDVYYSNVLSICANPKDYALPLHNMGLKYTKLTEYELFNLMFPMYQETIRNTKLDFIFAKDITLLEMKQDKNTNELSWYNKDGQKVIDKYTHSLIDERLRELTGIEKNIKKAGNSIQYEREIKKKKEELKKKSDNKTSFLENEIIMTVNDCNFKYDYETVLNLTLYQFNKSVKQILHSKELDYIKSSAYVGMFDIKKLKAEETSLIPIANK